MEHKEAAIFKVSIEYIFKVSILNLGQLKRINTDLYCQRTYGLYSALPGKTLKPYVHQEIRSQCGT